MADRCGFRWSAPYLNPDGGITSLVQVCCLAADHDGHHESSTKVIADNPFSPVSRHARDGETPSDERAILSDDQVELIREEARSTATAEGFMLAHGSPTAHDILLLCDSHAALRAKIDEPGPCYVMADGECISPFKCAHGDGLSLDEFVRRVTTASVPPEPPTPVDERGYESLEPGGDDTNAFDDDDFSVPPEPPTLSDDYAERFAVFAFSLDGFNSLDDRDQQTCRDAREFAHRIAQEETAALRAELAEATVERRAADYLAGVCSLAVHRHKIDARSEIGDALLDYASTRYGDSNPIGGVDATYQKLRAARAASGKDHSNQQTGRDRQETESNG